MKIFLGILITMLIGTSLGIVITYTQEERDSKREILNLLVNLSQVDDIVKENIYTKLSYDGNPDIKNLPKDLKLNYKRMDYKISFDSSTIILNKLNDEELCGKNFIYKYNDNLIDIHKDFSFSCKENNTYVKVDGDVRVRK